MNLVTGATGQIGTVLVRELCKRNENTRILVRKNSNLGALHDLPLELVVGDILDKNSLQQAMKGVNNVFHLAGLIPTKPGADKMMSEVNADGTSNVCEVALESGVKKLVYVSTVQIFSRNEKKIIDEGVPLDLNSPSGSYQSSKIEATREVLEKAKQGLDAVVLCPSGVIGISDCPTKDEMTKALLSFACGKVNLVVKGAFDFVDVRDVVQGLIAARANGRSGELYILSGTRVTITDLHRLTQQIAGVSTPRLIVPDWLAFFGIALLQRLLPLLKMNSGYNNYTLQALQGNTFYSSEKARRVLDYSPRPLKDSIYDCLRLYNKI